MSDKENSGDMKHKKTGGFKSVKFVELRHGPPRAETWRVILVLSLNHWKLCTAFIRHLQHL